MSIEAIAYVKLLPLGEAEGPSARLLLYVVAENTFNDSGLCKVGQAELAHQTRVSERTVRRQLEALEPKIIRRHSHFGDGSGREPDAIELVGFKAWLAGERAQPQADTLSGRPCKEPQSPEADNLSGRPCKEPQSPEADNLSGRPCNSQGATGQSDRGNRTMMSGSYKDSRTSTPVQDSPPTPPRGAGREGGYKTLLKELRAEGKPAHVIDAFLAPVADALIIGHSDPRGLFSAICTALADKPERLLAMAATEMISGKGRRAKIVAVKNAVDVVEQVAPRAMIKIPQGTDGFAAWRAYAVAHGMTGTVSLADKQGFFWQLTEYPPGHWQNQAAATTGAAA